MLQVNIPFDIRCKSNYRALFLASFKSHLYLRDRNLRRHVLDNSRKRALCSLCLRLLKVILCLKLGRYLLSQTWLMSCNDTIKFLRAHFLVLISLPVKPINVNPMYSQHHAGIYTKILTMLCTMNLEQNSTPMASHGSSFCG